MIEDKEKLIEELEEHLSQVLSATPFNPFAFTDREMLAIYMAGAKDLDFLLYLCSHKSNEDFHIKLTELLSCV